MNIKNFLEKAKSVKLTPEEKLGVLNYLKTEMVKNPVRNGALLGHKLWSINNFSAFGRSAVGGKLTSLLNKPMPIAIIIALLIGGGVSAAAEQSLPGDTLFPVKVSINEKVRGILAISGESEAKLQTKLAERRLEEAEKLAAQSNFKEEVRIHVAENFQRHADKVRAKIAELEAENSPKAIEIASHLKTSLEAHARILQNLETSLDGQTGVELQKIKLMIETHRDQIDEKRTKHEDRIKTEVGPKVQTAAEGKLNAVENKMAEVKKFLANHSDRFSAEAKTQAEARLKLAEETLLQGQAKLETKVFGEAFLLFQKTHNILQEVKLLLNAKIELEDRHELKDEDQDQDKEEETKEVKGETETEIKLQSDGNHNELRGKIKIDLE